MAEVMNEVVVGYVCAPAGVRTHTSSTALPHAFAHPSFCCLLARSLTQVVRTTLLPAALKTLGANKDAPLPIK